MLECYDDESHINTEIATLKLIMLFLFLLLKAFQSLDQEANPVPCQLEDQLHIANNNNKKKIQ